MTNNDDYKVGYGKPPLHTRVKPGERKNPKGRPKGAKNLNTILEKAMDAPAVIRENGKTRRVSRTEVIIVGQIKKAAEGDTRAAQLLLDKKSQIDAARPSDTGQRTLSAPDSALLEDYKRRILEEEKARGLRPAALSPEGGPESSRSATGEGGDNE